MAMENLGALIFPKPPATIKRQHQVDFQGTGGHSFGHVSRMPNSDYKTRLMQYNQRKLDLQALSSAKILSDIKEDVRTTEQMLRNANRAVRVDFAHRLKNKCAQIQIGLSERQEKLRRLLLQERKQDFLETIEYAQRGKEMRLQELVAKLEESRRKEEEKRQQLVEEKRFQQKVEKCEPLRDLAVKRNLVESKKYQLQQIEANNRQKLAEKELEMMWHRLKMKNVEAMEEREMEEALIRKMKDMDDGQIRNRQLEGKQLMLEEISRCKQEDLREMERIAEEIRQEKIAELEKKERERQEKLKFFQEQIREKEENIRRIKEEDQFIEDARRRMAADEIEAEKKGNLAAKEMAKLELKMFMNYQKQLKEARLRDEKAFEQFTNEERLRFEKIKIESGRARCEYMQRMKQEIMEGLKQQVESKKQQKKDELEEKKRYEECLLQTLEMNKKIEAEQNSHKKAELIEYYNGLKEQHKYRLLQEERAKLEEEAIQRAAAVDEEELDTMLKLFWSGELSLSQHTEHPFTPMISQKICKCPQ